MITHVKVTFWDGSVSRVDYKDWDRIVTAHADKKIRAVECTVLGGIPTSINLDDVQILSLVSESNLTKYKPIGKGIDDFYEELWPEKPDEPEWKS